MLKQVPFDNVPVGSFFMEIGSDTPHLKTDAQHGMYQAWGTRYEPTFKPDELVVVESTQ